MTNSDLLKLPEGVFKITDGNFKHTLEIKQQKDKKGNLLFIIKPQFGIEIIWLEPKEVEEDESDFIIQTWTYISDFHFKGKIDLSKYKIQP